MADYTITHPETGQEITFEWFGKKEPTQRDAEAVFTQAEKDKPMPPEPTRKENLEKFVGGVEKTTNALADPMALAETGASLATSAYGIPLSGLAGLLALGTGQGLETAGKWVEGVQKATIYQPQSEKGQDLTKAVGSPMEALDKVGEWGASKVDNPDLKAAIHSAPAGVAAILGGKYALKKGSPITKKRAAATKKLNDTIDTGFNRSIKPLAGKKEMYGQVQRAKKDARVAVTEIIKNKEKLQLTDVKGNPIEGLPKTVEQFSQAIEQTKKVIFEEYDVLAKQSDAGSSIKIDLQKVGSELTPVINNKALKVASPETIAYAQSRIEALNEYGTLTAVETQEAIQVLNQTQKHFYAEPSPALKGRAMVDSMLANNLRRQLDSTILKTTGKEYQALKNKYGALRSVEKSVTKRSIDHQRKLGNTIYDFTDMYTGYHVIRGVLAADPTTIGAGLAAKGIKKYVQMRNNPDRLTNNMFKNADKLMMEQ